MISKELYSDLCLSTLCVFITTTIFIGHFVTSFTVLIVVVACLVNILGFMHFWNMTIETVSCINLSISTGLVVDYRSILHLSIAFLLNNTPIILLSNTFTISLENRKECLDVINKIFVLA